MSKAVRIQTITPEFVKDVDPAFIGQVVKRLIEGDKTPFGILLIGTQDEADRFAEQHLFVFGPVRGSGGGVGE